MMHQRRKTHADSEGLWVDPGVTIVICVTVVILVCVDLGDVAVVRIGVESES